MSVQIREPISVAAVFDHGAVKPVLFRWKEKKIKIDQISFSWKTREGISKLLHFSVVSGKILYELVFNTKELTWNLEQIAIEIS